MAPAREPAGGESGQAGSGAAGPADAIVGEGGTVAGGGAARGTGGSGEVAAGAAPGAAAGGAAGETAHEMASSGEAAIGGAAAGSAVGLAAAAAGSAVGLAAAAGGPAAAASAVGLAAAAAGSAAGGSAAAASAAAGSAAGGSAAVASAAAGSAAGGSAAGGSAAGGSFSPFLLDWQTAVQRADRGRRLLETLHQVVKERAVLEESYAEGLRGLARKMSSALPASESAGALAAAEALCRDLGRRGQHAAEFADALRTDIVAATLTNTIENHLAVLRQIAADAAAAGRRLQAAARAVKNAEGEYFRAGRAAFRAASAAESARGGAVGGGGGVGGSSKDGAGAGGAGGGGAASARGASRGSTAGGSATAGSGATSSGSLTSRSPLDVSSASAAPSSPSTAFSARTSEEAAAAAVAALVQAQRRYHLAVRQWNGCRAAYRRQLGQILQVIRDMDKKRLSCFKDALRRLLVFQTAALRNQQYDTSATVEVVEALDEEKDIAEFVRRAGERGGAAAAPAAAAAAPTLPAADYVAKHWVSAYLPASPSGAEGPLAAILLAGAAAAGGGDDELAAGAAGGAGADAKFLRRAPFTLNVVQTAAARFAGAMAAAGAEGGATPGAAPAAADRAPPEVAASPAAFLDWLAAAPTRGRLSSSPGAPPRRGALHPLAAPVNPAPLKRSIALHRERYTDLLDMVWNFVPEMSEVLCAAVAHLRDDFRASADHRQTFTQCLAAKAERGMLELPSVDALQALSAAAASLLEAADTQWDPAVVLDALVLAQRFFARGPVNADPQLPGRRWRWPHLRANPSDFPPPPGDGARVAWYLHRALYTHIVWGRVHMWEEVFALAYRRELQRRVLEDARRAATAAAGRPEAAAPPGDDEAPPPETLVLDNFGECMVSFGIPEEHVAALLQRVCADNDVPPEEAARRFARRPPDAAKSTSTRGDKAVDGAGGSLRGSGAAPDGDVSSEPADARAPPLATAGSGGSARSSSDALRT